MEPPEFPYFEAELKENFLDPRRQILSIDRRFISYGEKIVDCDNIEEMRYGSMQMLIFHRLRTDKYHKIELKDRGGNVLKIFFGQVYVQGKEINSEDAFDMILHSLWHAVKKRLVNEALEKIGCGQRIGIGKCSLSHEGVTIEGAGFVRRKCALIKWADLEREVDHGKFILRSKSNKNIKYKINFLHTWNSVVLFSIIEFKIKENLKHIDNLTRIP